MRQSSRSFLVKIVADFPLGVSQASANIFRPVYNLYIEPTFGVLVAISEGVVSFVLKPARV